MAGRISADRKPEVCSQNIWMRDADAGSSMKKEKRRRRRPANGPDRL
jgi:hypothetical protein